MPRRLHPDAYAEGVLGGDRARLGQAITLVESRLSSDEALAQELLARLLPHTGQALRVGITGVPGVGKSTLIDRLGALLLERGHRLAVLAVDPSSALSGGSILGDKTRMPTLAVDPRAFIRPSPSARSLGGVTRRTREAMLVCEAAGFDVVLVETVGVGQSEVSVAEMVDCFVVLMLPGAGDELQGIKRGILELADVVAVNKADGDNLDRARRSLREYRAAMRYTRPCYRSWTPQALTVSGLRGDGLDALWGLVEEHHQALSDSGELDEARAEQRLRWMWSLLEEGLMSAFRAHPEVRAQLPGIEAAVERGDEPPTRAVRELLQAFGITESGTR